MQDFRRANNLELVNSLAFTSTEKTLSIAFQPHNRKILFSKGDTGENISIIKKTTAKLSNFRQTIFEKIIKEHIHSRRLEKYGDVLINEILAWANAQGFNIAKPTKTKDSAIGNNNSRLNIESNTWNALHDSFLRSYNDNAIIEYFVASYRARFNTNKLDDVSNIDNAGGYSKLVKELMAEFAYSEGEIKEVLQLSEDELKNASPVPLAKSEAEFSLWHKIPELCARKLRRERIIPIASIVIKTGPVNTSYDIFSLSQKISGLLPGNNIQVNTPPELSLWPKSSKLDDKLKDMPAAVTADLCLQLEILAGIMGKVDDVLAAKLISDIGAYNKDDLNLFLQNLKIFNNLFVDKANVSLFRTLLPDLPDNINWLCQDEFKSLKLLLDILSKLGVKKVKSFFNLSDKEAKFSQLKLSDNLKKLELINSLSIASFTLLTDALSDVELTDTLSAAVSSNHARIDFVKNSKIAEIYASSANSQIRFRFSNNNTLKINDIIQKIIKETLAATDCDKAYSLALSDALLEIHNLGIAGLVFTAWFESLLTAYPEKQSGVSAQISHETDALKVLANGLKSEGKNLLLNIKNYCSQKPNKSNLPDFTNIFNIASPVAVDFANILKFAPPVAADFANILKFCANITAQKQDKEFIEMQCRFIAALLSHPEYDARVYMIQRVRYFFDQSLELSNEAICIAMQMATGNVANIVKLSLPELVPLLNSLAEGYLSCRETKKEDKDRNRGNTLVQIKDRSKWMREIFRIITAEINSVPVYSQETNFDLVPKNDKLLQLNNKYKKLCTIVDEALALRFITELDDKVFSTGLDRKIFNTKLGGGVSSSKLDSKTVSAELDGETFNTGSDNEISLNLNKQDLAVIKIFNTWSAKIISLKPNFSANINILNKVLLGKEIDKLLFMIRAQDINLKFQQYLINWDRYSDSSRYFLLELFENDGIWQYRDEERNKKGGKKQDKAQYNLDEIFLAELVRIVQSYEQGRCSATESYAKVLVEHLSLLLRHPDFYNKEQYNLDEIFLAELARIVQSYEQGRCSTTESYAKVLVEYLNLLLRHPDFYYLANLNKLKLENIFKAKEALQVLKILAGDTLYCLPTEATKAINMLKENNLIKPQSFSLFCEIDSMPAKVNLADLSSKFSELLVATNKYRLERKSNKSKGKEELQDRQVNINSSFSQSYGEQLKSTGSELVALHSKQDNIDFEFIISWLDKVGIDFALFSQMIDKYNFTAEEFASLLDSDEVYVRLLSVANDDVFSTGMSQKKLSLEKLKDTYVPKNISHAWLKAIATGKITSKQFKQLCNIPLKKNLANEELKHGEDTDKSEFVEVIDDLDTQSTSITVKNSTSICSLAENNTLARVLLDGAITIPQLETILAGDYGLLVRRLDLSIKHTVGVDEPSMYKFYRNNIVAIAKSNANSKRARKDRIVLERCLDIFHENEDSKSDKTIAFLQKVLFEFNNSKNVKDILISEKALTYLRSICVFSLPADDSSKLTDYFYCSENTSVDEFVTKFRVFNEFSSKLDTVKSVPSHLYNLDFCMFSLLLKQGQKALDDYYEKGLIPRDILKKYLLSAADDTTKNYLLWRKNYILGIIKEARNRNNSISHTNWSTLDAVISLGDPNNPTMQGLTKQNLINFGDKLQCLLNSDFISGGKYDDTFANILHKLDTYLDRDVDKSELKYYKDCEIFIHASKQDFWKKIIESAKCAVDTSGVINYFKKLLNDATENRIKKIDSTPKLQHKAGALSRLYHAILNVIGFTLSIPTLFTANLSHRYCDFFYRGGGLNATFKSCKSTIGRDAGEPLVNWPSITA